MLGVLQVSCATNQNKAARAAAFSGIPELAGKAAGLSRPAQSSPQSKWAALDRAYLQANPKADLKTFQHQRREFMANNVKQFNRAIQAQRQVALHYRPAGSKKTKRYELLPLDVKGGLFDSNKHQRYVWGFSESRNLPLCFRLERVARVEMLAPAFDPNELRTTRKRKNVKYNLPRPWGRSSLDGKKARGRKQAGKKKAGGKKQSGEKKAGSGQEVSG